MNFKEIYNATDDSFKMQFLFELLEKDNRLQKVFLNSIPSLSSVGSKPEQNFDDFSRQISRSYENFLDRMQIIDIAEVDWDDYIPPHSGYVEEWEAYESMAEREIENAFSDFENNLLQFLLQGRVSGVIVELIAFLKAAFDNDIDDPNCIFDGVEDYLINYKLKEWINFTIKKLPDSRLDDNEILNALKLFFRYFKENIDPEYILLFEKLLLYLLEKIQDKNKLPSLNKITSINKKYFPKLATEIIKHTDKTNWEKTAVELMFDDKSVAEELLDKYLKSGERDKYIKTAGKLFESDEHYWAEKIINHIKRQDDERFFVKLNLRYCIDSNNVKYYIKIKELLTENDKRNILAKLNYNLELKAEILKEEKEYEKIKELIKESAGSWDFTNVLLNTIKDYDPDFTLEMIRIHVAKLMSDSKRNRSTYQRIAGFLKYAKTIESQQEKVDELILSLYNHKPNLPALKDEFRKAFLK